MTKKATETKNERGTVSPDIIIGKNAVKEALKSGIGVNKLLIAGSDGTTREIVALAKERGIVVENCAREKLDRLADGARHQGTLAYIAPIKYVDIDDILEIAARKNEPPLLLLPDEIEDPHNLGALIRTADAAGVHGILLPKRRSAPVNATTAKTSAGAVFHVPIARTGNTAQTLRLLKDKGFWVFGADMNGEKNYCDTDFTGATVIVVGSEGRGISRIVRENCDVLVKIPMRGKINSLNASVAGALLIYEAARQRIRNDE